MASTITHAQFVDGLVRSILKESAIRAVIDTEMASGAKRPMICVLTVKGVDHCHSEPTTGVTETVDIKFVKDASIKRQMFNHVPSLKMLASMGKQCPAPILVRFEITFSNDRREFGVMAYNP